MTALSPKPPPSDPLCNVCKGICSEQECVICVRCISKFGLCFGIAQTTSCIGMIFRSCPSFLPTFTIELSALDRIYALENKLEKVDSLISEIQSLKLEINFLKKQDYPYLSAAFRNRTDSIASARYSKKMCFPAKSLTIENQKFLRRAQILIIRGQSVQLKVHLNDGIFTLVVETTLSLRMI